MAPSARPDRDASPLIGVRRRAGSLLAPAIALPGPSARLDHRGPAGAGSVLRGQLAPPTVGPVEADLGGAAVVDTVDATGTSAGPTVSAAPAAPVGRRARTVSTTASGAALTGPAGRLLEIERVGSTIGLLRIGKPAGLTFTAGQYLRLGLTGVRRAKFTIASAPHDSHLEVCVEAIPGGRLTPRLLALAPGAVLDVDDRAKGGFVLDGSGAVHLMVATGTGIAPFRSMVRDAIHRDLPASFLVLHGASFADDLPYRDELEALAAGDERVRYIPTVSRPEDPRNRTWSGRTGRVDALVGELAATVAGPGTRAYACGNGAMVGNVTALLKARGLKVASETFD